MNALPSRRPRLNEWLESYDQGTLPVGILSERLSTIIHAWELLHSFIKPVLDADNLKVPHPLVHFLTEHIGGLRVVAGAKFVTEISPQLNYFQHSHTDLRNAISFLQSLVRGPAIEPRLGFLALPCSQSRNLFTNCLLYHEVGHFIAEETSLLAHIEITKLSDELESKFGEYKRWAASRIRRLMEELFADIVAVRLAGLAYTLSYMELIRLVSDDLTQHAKRFFVDHPADALRFREQLKILEHDKWGEYGARLPQWAELKKISQVTELEYLVPKEYQNDVAMTKIWKMLIETLCNEDRLKRLHEQVDGVLADRVNPYERFVESAAEVEECLGHGIVPSLERGGHSPHPLAIINGAVIFWLSGMSELYRIVPRCSGKKVEDLDIPGEPG